MNPTSNLALLKTIGPWTEAQAIAPLQLLPAGVFRARDGRPNGLSGWRIDRAIAARIIARAETQSSGLVIDYDHQTENAAANGRPAPAAGWFKNLEWREGVGLFALNVQWTDTARKMIAAHEYRYISPVFAFDGKTGEVQAIFRAGLTNTPALDELPSVALSMMEEKMLQAHATLPRGRDALATGRDGLTDAERAVCNRLGLDPTAFLETQREHAEIAALRTTRVETVGQDGLTDSERRTTYLLNLDPAEFLRTKQETAR